LFFKISVQDRHNSKEYEANLRRVRKVQAARDGEGSISGVVLQDEPQPAAGNYRDEE